MKTDSVLSFLEAYLPNFYDSYNIAYLGDLDKALYGEEEWGDGDGVESRPDWMQEMNQKEIYEEFCRLLDELFVEALECYKKPPVYIDSVYSFLLEYLPQRTQCKYMALIDDCEKALLGEEEWADDENIEDRPEWLQGMSKEKIYEEMWRIVDELFIEALENYTNS